MSRTNRDGSTLRNGKPRTYKSVYPSTQPSPATRNSPRETRNSGNQSTSSQPLSRATSGRKLPPNPIDLTGPTNEQQQQEENNNVLNTGTNNVNVQHNTEQTMVIMDKMVKPVIFKMDNMVKLVLFEMVTMD